MNRLDKCPIWNNYQAVGSETSDNSGYDVNSLRAGGKFKITNEAINYLKSNEDNILKANLSLEILRANKFNIDYVITEKTIEELNNRSPLKFTEKAIRGLKFLISKSDNYGKFIEFSKIEKTFAIEIFTTENVIHLSHCLFPMLQFYVDKNYIKLDTRNPSYNINITQQGYEYIESLENTYADSNQGFIAMWFDPSMDEVRDNGFIPAIEDAGYKAMIISQKEHINKIDDEIIAEIRKSKFIVADFTSEIDKPRGGVYYEAGFAQGLGLPVFWTCRKDMIENVHFDTRQYRHILWTVAQDLRLQLKLAIEAAIGRGNSL